MLLIFLLLQASEKILPLDALIVDKVFVGQIHPSDRSVRSKFIDEKVSPIPVRAKTFLVSVPHSGKYYIDMQSRFFDTYIVLRDSAGSFLADDDDGWIPSQSRLVIDLQSSREYLLDACALHGGVGSFEISVREGEPQGPNAIELDAWKFDPRGVAATLRAEGSLKLEDGQFDEAQNLFGRALDLAEKNLGGGAQETAGILYDLGRLSNRRFQFSVARDFLQRAIEAQEALLGVEDLQTCDSYEQLAISLSMQGDTHVAKMLFERAKRGFEKHLMSEDSRVAYEVLVRCAVVSFRLGDWAGAEKRYRECLPVASNCYGAESSQFSNNLTMLATCLFYLGDWTQAKECYERALVVQERQGRAQASLTTEIRRRLAALVMEEGSFRYAEHLLKLAIDDPKGGTDPEGIEVALACSLLATSHQKRGNPLTARQSCQRAIGIFRRILGESSYYVVDCYIKLAGISMDLLDLRQAGELLGRADRLNQSLSDRMFAATRVRILAATGRLQFLQGDLKGARESFLASKSLAEGRFVDGPFLEVQILHDLTRVAIEGQDTEGAWSSARSAYILSELRFGQLIWSLTESERYNLVSSQREALDFILALSQKTKDPMALEIAFDSLLAWKGRVFQGMLAAKERIQSAENRELDVAVSRLRRVQAEMSRLGSRSPVDEPPALSRLESLVLDRERLERTIARLVGPNATSNREKDWRVLQSSLPEGATFINFIESRSYVPSVRKEGRVLRPSSWGNPEISAWILASGYRSPRRVDLGSSSEIEKLLQSFLEELIAQKSAHFVKRLQSDANLNSEVYRRIWVPLKEHIEGDLVFVSSDGCLGSLPFGVIQREDGRYLIEDYRFVNLQDSLGLGAFPGKSQDTQRDLLVVGGVDFQEGDLLDRLDVGSNFAAVRGPTASSLRNWKSLPSTLDEARAISKIHEAAYPEGSRSSLYGKIPSEARIKMALPTASFVHIATHGFFHPDGVNSLWQELSRDRGPSANGSLGDHSLGFLPGLLSGIVCAGANLPTSEGQEDGLLTAEEVSWLDLSKCDLVVLSACQTGLGTVRGGDAVIGLRSAFRQAGVRTVISSLWAVGDESTRDLMIDFYRALWLEGRGKLDALRLSQIKALERQRQAYGGQAFPYAWGAFVLEGDWR